MQSRDPFWFWTWWQWWFIYNRNTDFGFLFDCCCFVWSFFQGLGGGEWKHPQEDTLYFLVVAGKHSYCNKILFCLTKPMWNLQRQMRPIRKKCAFTQTRFCKLSPRHINMWPLPSASSVCSSSLSLCCRDPPYSDRVGRQLHAQDVSLPICQPLLLAFLHCLLQGKVWLIYLL